MFFKNATEKKRRWEKLIEKVLCCFCYLLLVLHFLATSFLGNEFKISGKLFIEHNFLSLNLSNSAFPRAFCCRTFYCDSARKLSVRFLLKWYLRVFFWRSFNRFLWTCRRYPCELSTSFDVKFFTSFLLTFFPQTCRRSSFKISVNNSFRAISSALFGASYWRAFYWLCWYAL